jgi:dTDP-4-dehydrorhamnose reductase
VTRLLVTGAGGQVGTYLTTLLEGYDVVACGRADLDVADRDAVEQVVAATAPDVIINTAAMTDVDGCEADPDRAYAVNALGVRWLAGAANRVGAHLVHVSTDYVFDGAAREPYREWDTVRPISVYGASKLGGELECARHATSWAIARTSWVYGKRGGDFVSWVLDAAAAGKLKGLVDDQTGSPTYAADLARVLRDLAVRRTQGVFHAANAGAATRLEQGLAVLELAGRSTEGVGGMPSSALPRPAARPTYSALADTALRPAGIEPMRHWRDALEAYLRVD